MEREGEEAVGTGTWGREKNEERETSIAEEEKKRE